MAQHNTTRSNLGTEPWHDLFTLEVAIVKGPYRLIQRQEHQILVSGRSATFTSQWACYCDGMFASSNLTNGTQFNLE